MDIESVVVAIVIVGVIVLLAIGVLPSIRVVGPDEQLVVFRLGRTDPSMVRGPGRTFLLPIVDRAVSVDMRNQHFALDHLAATTRDGRAVEADVDIRCRVVDPYHHVVNVAIFPAALGGVTADRVRAAVEALTLDEALHGTRVEEAIRPDIEAVVKRWGVACSSIEVRRLEAIEAAPTGR